MIWYVLIPSHFVEEPPSVKIRRKRAERRQPSAALGRAPSTSTESTAALETKSTTEQEEIQPSSDAAPSAAAPTDTSMSKELTIAGTNTWLHVTFDSIPTIKQKS